MAGGPILLFVEVPPSDLVLALNELIEDINAQLLIVGGGGGAGSYSTLAALIAAYPSPAAGLTAYVGNVRKIGEGSGSGTGAPVYYSTGSWRVFSTDAPALT